jgi:hypothetical protein
MAAGKAIVRRRDGCREAQRTVTARRRAARRRGPGRGPGRVVDDASPLPGRQRPQGLHPLRYPYVRGRDGSALRRGPRGARARLRTRRSRSCR